MNNRKIDFRYAPPSVWTNIGLIDDQYKSIVREDGALLYDFRKNGMEAWWFNRVFEFGIRSGCKANKITQSTLTSKFPCVVTTIVYPKATLTLKTFAHLENEKRTDIVLWEIELNENVEHFLTGLTVDIYDRLNDFCARSTAPAREIFAIPFKDVVEEGFSEGEEAIIEDESLPAPGPLVFVSDPHRLIANHPQGFTPHTAFGMPPTVLKKGEKLQGAIIVPLEGQEAGDFTYEWAKNAFTTQSKTWENEPRLNLPISVPDDAVMDMVIACARNILQAREIEEGLPVFKVGPTIYRGLWVVDGHFMLEAAQYMGLKKDAFRGLDALLKRVKPDGSITIFEFHTKETAISLLTLIRQCELMGDLDRLRALWPTIQNGMAHLQKLREEAYALPADDPCYKLVPMSFGDGGLGGKRGEYTTILWIMAGIRGVVNAAYRLDMTNDAKKYEAMYDQLIIDFNNSTKRDMQQLDSLDYVPMNMPGSGDHLWIPDYPYETPDYHKLTPISATWAFCQAIYPGEVFAPNDPLVKNLLALLDRFDDVEGIPANSGWIPYQALWSYHASFAAHAWLYAGNSDKAIDYLYNFANHASSTRVWREEQSLTHTDEGQLWGEMPHNWASAEFIRLVRHLLVFEVGEDLQFLSGLPKEWRQANQEVKLTQTPTRYGPVDLNLSTFENGTFELCIEMNPDWPLQPKQMQITLPASNLSSKNNIAFSTNGSLVSFAYQDKIMITGKWN